MSIRTADTGDIPALMRIWAEIFGDDDAFISAFFRCLFPHASAFVAEQDGRIVGSAYVLEICSLKCGSSELPCPYIYAVGVLEEFRGAGIGAALTLACRELCARRGRLSCLVPAEPGLFSYYERTAGYAPSFSLNEFTVHSAESSDIAVSRITPAEYSDMREELLADTCHLKFIPEAIEFLHSSCLMQGGLYIASSPDAYAVAACELCSSELCIKELLCSNSHHQRFASALLSHFGKDSCLCRAPADKEHPESSRTFGMLSEAASGGPFYFGPAFD